MQRDLGIKGFIAVLFGTIIICMITAILLTVLFYIFGQSLTAILTDGNLAWAMFLSILFYGAIVFISLYLQYRILNIPCRYCTADETSPMIDYLGIWRKN